jgi:O-antigen/teichoic acid export membrane protein
LSSGILNRSGYSRGAAFGSNLRSAILRPSQGPHAVLQTLVAKVSILALNAATGILTARMLRPAARGELTAIILWPVFLASLFSFGLQTSLVFHLRKCPEEQGPLVSTALWAGLVSGSMAAVVGAIFIPLWLRQYPPQIVTVARWFLLSAPLCSLMIMGRSVFEGRGDYYASNLVQLFTPVPSLLALLGLSACHRMTPFSAGLAYLLGGIPVFVWMMRRLLSALSNGTGRPRFAANMRSLKKLLHYGGRSYGIDLLGTLALQVDQLLVIGLLAPAAMGAYVVALSLSRVLNVFQQSAVMVLFPKAAGAPVDAVIAMTGRAARLSTIVAAACALLPVAFGPILIRLVYGSAYGAAVSALRILVMEVVLAGLTYVLAQAFMALGRPGVVTLLQAAGLAISVPLMLWWIPRFGIAGAALALLCSTAARLLLVMTALKVMFRPGRLSLLPRAEDVRTLWDTITKPVPLALVPSGELPS